MDILQANRFALEQLVLENTNVHYIPNEGIVPSEYVTSRWYVTPVDLQYDFFIRSGWFKLLTQTEGLVVPSNICSRLTPYPVFYNGHPFLCFVHGRIPLLNPNDFKSKFIPPVVRMVTETSVCYLVKYGKYYSFSEYIRILKEESNFGDIKSFVDDYVELITSFTVLGYHGLFHIIDGKLYTFLDRDYKKRGIDAKRRNFNVHVRELADYFIQDGYQEVKNYIESYIDKFTGQSEIVRVTPDFKVGEVDSKDVSPEELGDLLDRSSIDLGILDMLMSILSDSDAKKEIRFRASITKDIRTDIIRVYINYFPYTRIGDNQSIRRAEDFVKQFKKNPSELYKYQEKLAEFLSGNEITHMSLIGTPPVVEKFTLLMRSYNILRLRSEDAARRSLDKSRWINYVPVNPNKTSNLLAINENKYSSVIFYNTPLYNAVVLSVGDYDVNEFPYLDTQDKKLIELFLQGVIMPMTFYAGLSDKAFNNLSASGSFLDLYENLGVRKLIDLSFVLGEAPGEYILGKSKELLELNLPGVDELLNILM